MAITVNTETKNDLLIATLQTELTDLAERVKAIERHHRREDEKQLPLHEFTVCYIDCDGTPQHSSIEAYNEFDAAFWLGARLSANSKPKYPHRIVTVEPRA